MKTKKLSLLITLCATMSVFSLTGCSAVADWFNKTFPNNKIFNNGGILDNIGGGNNQNNNTYYVNINAEANNLLSQLQTLNANKLTKRVGYSTMLSNSKNFGATDIGSRKGLITAFYNGSSVVSSQCNREHVWPASRTVLGRNNDPLEDDIHMVRPTLSSDNGSRGNSFYVEGMFQGSGGWDPGCTAAVNSGFDPSYRGDCARIIFYCVVADPKLKLVDKNDDSTNNHTMGKLSDLLKWNLQYPVQEREKVRNNEAEKLQGNRNPFIDHPEYATKIWGNYNTNTRSVCASFF